MKILRTFRPIPAILPKKGVQTIVARGKQLFPSLRNLVLRFKMLRWYYSRKDRSEPTIGIKGHFTPLILWSRVEDRELILSGVKRVFSYRNSTWRWFYTLDNVNKNHNMKYRIQLFRDLFGQFWQEDWLQRRFECKVLRSASVFHIFHSLLQFNALKGLFNSPKFSKTKYTMLFCRIIGNLKPITRSVNLEWFGTSRAGPEQWLEKFCVMRESDMGLSKVRTHPQDSPQVLTNINLSTAMFFSKSIQYETLICQRLFTYIIESTLAD